MPRNPLKIQQSPNFIVQLQNIVLGSIGGTSLREALHGRLGGLQVFQSGSQIVLLGFHEG
jgi:hypothetical protein